MKKNEVLKKFKNILNSIVKILKRIVKRIVKLLNEFGKMQFGKFNGKHIVGVIVVLVLFIFMLSFAGSGTKSLDYPVVYKSNDNKLLLLNTDTKVGKEVKLSGEGAPSYVKYANTTDRYLLFVKNDGLYLYDAKSKEETTKIVSNISNYYKFTDNDKYVVMMDDNRNLYSYGFKGDKERLDSSIKSVEDISNTNVIYSKDGALYVAQLNAKKSAVKISETVSQARVTNDGKTVYYINNSKELYSYNVSKDRNTKVDTSVSQMFISKETGKMYYVTSEGNQFYTVYFYDKKNSEKIATEVTSVLDVNVDNEQLLYMTRDEDYEIYFRKGTKDAVKINEKFESSPLSARIFDGKAIYYINAKKELKYVKINGAKVGRVIKVSGGIDSELFLTKKGYVYVKGIDGNSLGELYIANNGKAEKIDENVYFSNIKISTDGTKIYYLKDYSNNVGTLCVSNNGNKGKEIAKDIYSYQYVNNDLLYFVKNYNLESNQGDLYRYDGKAEKLATDVNGVATTPNGYVIK